MLHFNREPVHRLVYMYNLEFKALSMAQPGKKQPAGMLRSFSLLLFPSLVIW
jgi:hypothetical protein